MFHFSTSNHQNIQIKLCLKFDPSKDLNRLFMSLNLIIKFEFMCLNPHLFISDLFFIDFQ